MHDRKFLRHAPARDPLAPAARQPGPLHPSEKSAGNAARIRQRILAVFLPIAAVLYISCEALDPKGTDQVVTNIATGLKLLVIASRHPTQLYAAGTLSLLALGAVAVSYAAIAMLVTGRGWVIATGAALLGSIGAFCGAITNVLVGVDLAAAATAHTSPDAAARFLVTAFNSGAGQLFTYLYAASEYAAPVLMGFALWRSRRVPLWLAALFTIGFEVAETQSAKGPIVIAFMLPWGIAMALLAARIWQTAGQPGTSPRRSPSPCLSAASSPSAGPTTSPVPETSPHPARSRPGAPMRSVPPPAARRKTRNRRSAATVSCVLLGAAALFSAAVLPATAASASPGPPRASSVALRAVLRGDLSDYLTVRGAAEHISAVSLRVTFLGGKPAISLAAGTTRYGGGPPVSASALWEIGSNTKAFTAVILLQLEAEGRLSINDPLGKWLPQYPAWRHITIRQLLDMTSRIPDYLYQPAFAAAFAADPSARFTAAQLVSYVAGLPLGPEGWNYTNTDYLLAQMIIDKVTHDSYADQLTRRIIMPLRLRTTCLAPYTCPSSDAARMPAGYFFIAGAPPPLLGEAMPPLALTWAQAAGGIVSSLADMTTWDRDLYQGQVLPARQQHQLESLVSQATGKPIARTTLADPAGYGLGIFQLTTAQTGTIWYYEGQAFGARVMNLYFPSSGMIIALAVNSSTDNDDLSDLAVSVYQALQQAGAVRTG
jgi:D-alanyl-D-alanine carboxypeptidase